MTLSVFPTDLVEALNRAVENLTTHVLDSLLSVNDNPILFTSPASNGKDAARALRDASGSLGTLAEALSAVEQKITRTLRAVKRRQHDYELALAPLSSLPNEILRFILQLAVMVPSPTAVSPVLIGQVYTRWRAVVYSHREFWDGFGVTYRTPFAGGSHRFLHVSPNEDLHISIGNTIPDAPLDAVPDSWSERLKSLIWASAQHPGAVQIPFTRRTNPFCDSEVMVVHQRSPSTPYITRLSELYLSRLFRDTCEKLRELTLAESDIDYLALTPMPQLHRLRLHGMTATPDSFRFFLSFCPTLENLEIQSLEVVFRTGPNAVLKLSHLHTLLTHNLSSYAARVILVPEAYPVLRSWTYLDFEPRHQDAHKQRQLVSMVRSFARNCASLEEMTLCATPYVIINIVGGEPVPAEPLEANAIHSESSSRIMPAPFAPALRRLELSTTPPNAEDTALGEDGRPSVVDAVLQFLQSRREDGLPPFEELVLHFCSTMAQQLRDVRLEQWASKLTLKPCEHAECRH